MNENMPPPAQDPAPSNNAAVLEALRTEQNLPMGVMGAIGAALIGAVLWAMITVATGYQIGYMAIAVGFMVGFANRALGKGIDPIFGIIGAACALLGCVLGNFFTIYAVLADTSGIGIMDAFGLYGISAGIELMKETFSAMDLLFYGIAIYEGYKFSFRQVTTQSA